MIEVELTPSSRIFSPEDVEKLREQGFVTSSGVVFHEELAGNSGMHFNLIATHDISDEQLCQSVNEIRVSRGVVGNITVSRQTGTGLIELILQWIALGEIPTTHDGENVDCIELRFLTFEAGTHREDIWRWFEAQNSRFQVAHMTDGAYCHPFAAVNLMDVVKGICNARKLHGDALPATLKEARTMLKDMVKRTSHVWLTGLAWLDVLDAVIDGRDLKSNCRLI